MSGREAEIARLAADGLTLREISELLCVTLNTVKTHLEHVYQKLGVRNRAQLTRAVLEREQNHPNG